jgi:hypothetical protein
LIVNKRLGQRRRRRRRRDVLLAAVCPKISGV